MSTVSDPWVSIVTVVLNNRAGLKNTEKSIRYQTCHDYEWIVVDGGSTDGSLGVVKNSNVEDMKWISEADSGIYDAMNKGIEMASGRYVMFLNSGDKLSDEQVIEHITEQVGHTPGGVQGTLIVMGGVNLILTREQVVYRAPRPTEYMKHSVPTYHQAMLFPLTFLKHRKYDTSYRICGDYYIAALAYKLGYKFMTVDFPVADFEIGGLSYQHPFKLMREAMRVQKTVLDLSHPRTMVSAMRRMVNTFALHALNRVPFLAERYRQLSLSSPHKMPQSLTALRKL